MVCITRIRWRSASWLLSTAAVSLSVSLLARGEQGSGVEPPVQMTSQEDHQRTMDLLKLTSLPKGATSSSPDTYDEAQANPYPKLPDPLVSKNGKKVASADAWRKQRRGEIIEEFEREIYGRRPKRTPRVNWEVASTTPGTNGDVSVITKELVGHVDNSAYPLVTVDIRATLTTPTDATGPVPVIMQVGGGFGGARAGGAPSPCAPPGGAARGPAPAGRGGRPGGPGGPGGARGPSGPTWQ